MMLPESIFKDKEIRIIDNYVSIFDIISIVSGQKNPRDIWCRIKEKNINLCSYTYLNFKRQKGTPCIHLDKLSIFIKILIPNLRLSLQKKVEILQCFGIKELPIRKYIEEEINEKLIKCFSNHEYKTQFKILNYRIDLYFPRLRIAIECDENHEQYNQELEIKREEEITDILKCTWIRFKPYDKNFDIFLLINKVHTEIQKLSEIVTTNSIKEEIEKERTNQERERTRQKEIELEMKKMEFEIVKLQMSKNSSMFA